MSAHLLRDVETFVRRFVVLDEVQAAAVTLWIAHTHALEAADATPYLGITSPEKRSGKSRLLEVLELLVYAPLQTVNISDAALFRVVDQESPTLLFDEIDAIFTARDREELRGLLNGGYRRGAVTHRMGGSNHRELQTFNVFCAKAFAGIGECLPDTITDRAVRIRLQRKRRDEHVERFRRREAAAEGELLRDRLADWLQPQGDYLAAARPELPDELDDRAQDVWEPLLAIADLAGEEWPQRARQTTLALSTGDEREDDSSTARLIRDVVAIFTTKGEERLKTTELLEGLHAMADSGWQEWTGGKPLTSTGLSVLLRPYRIKTMSVKAHGETVRGYKLEQFADAAARLGVTGVTGVTGESPSQAEGNAGNAGNAYAQEASRRNGLEREPDADEIERLAELAHRVIRERS